MLDCSVESFNIIVDNGQTSNTQTTVFQRKVFLSALLDISFLILAVMSTWTALDVCRY